jgi:hypothetical protein
MARCGPPPVLLIGATARPDPRGCLERLGGPMGGSVEQKSIVAGVRAAERRWARRDRVAAKPAGCPQGALRVRRVCVKGEGVGGRGGGRSR